MEKEIDRVFSFIADSMKKAILLSVFLIVLSSIAYAECVEPYENIEITGDTVFCTGTYYLNDTDTNGAIIINGDNLVLDCNNSIIMGDLTVDSKGIWIYNRNNVTIKNCILRNYRFSGIEIFNTNNSTIENFEISYGDMNNGFAIRIDYSNNIIIINGTIKNYGRGPHLDRTENISFKNINFENMSNVISQMEGDRVIIENCKANNMGGAIHLCQRYRPGWEITKTCNEHRIVNNEFINIRGNCLHFSSGENSIIENNSMVCGSIGILLYKEVEQVSFKNVSIINNTIKAVSHSIYLYNSSGYVKNNNLRNRLVILTPSGTIVLRNNNIIEFTFYSFRFIPFKPEEVNYIDLDGTNLVKGLPIYYLKNITYEINETNFPNTYVFYCEFCNNKIKNLNLVDTVLGGHFSNFIIDNISMSNIGTLDIVGNAIITNSKFNITYCFSYDRYNFTNIIFKDSIINNTYRDFYIANTNITLINVTTKPMYTYIILDDNSRILRKWYIDLSIISKIIPSVNIRDNKSNIVLSEITNNPKLIALEYIGYCPMPMCNNAGEVRDYYSPYTLEAKAPYYLTLSKTNDLTNNWIESYAMLPTTILSEMPILALFFIIIPSGVILLILRKLFSEFSIENIIGVFIIIILMVVILSILISIPSI